MDRYHQLLQDLRGPTTSWRRTVPAAWEGFVALHDGAMAEGEVPARLKEAAALAMGVVQRCEPCIAAHARAAARSGATPGEVAELLAVALLMGGAPARMHAPMAWEAYEGFRSEAAAATGTEQVR